MNPTQSAGTYTRYYAYTKGRASQLEILPEEISHINATESERACPIPVGAE